MSDNTEMDKDTAFGGKPPLPKKKTPISGKRLKTQSGGSVYDGNLAGDRDAVVPPAGGEGFGVFPGTQKRSQVVMTRLDDSPRG
mmetsp:Transcript_17897/g.51288  ORF Transcript_17897/g.51288 Transcript_17897/m.51288 type:complete len:84 (-) Transcript_17897:53-304(-)